MARIRTIKPEFFTSEDIVSLSPLARLLYVALWCEADREGRMAWKPRTFKIRYLPADSCDVEALCAEITAAGLVVLYGEGLAYIPAFARHQHVNPRESASTLPVPDASPTRDSRDSDVQVGKERKGREGKEEEQSASATADAPSRADPIPYQAIVDAYNSTMTKLPKVRELTAKRKAAIRRAWQETKERQSADFWLAYFEECDSDPFRNGTGPYRAPHEGWRPDFDFLIRSDQVTKVYEAAMSRMESAS